MTPRPTSPTHDRRRWWRALAVVLAIAQAAAADDAERPELEIVALRVVGDHPWQRTVVDDLDVYVRGGVRHLPLLRLIETFKIDPTASDPKLSFQFDGGPAATFDRGARRLTIDGRPQPADAIVRLSELTGQPEVYLPEPVMLKLLGLPLRFDEAEYAYVAKLGRTLSAWQAPERPTLLGIDALLVPTNLPELHGAATPAGFSVDYIDLQMRLGADVIVPADQEHQVTLGSLEQTFWGRAIGGGYKLRLAQPGWGWTKSQGIATSVDEADYVQIASFDWVKAYDGGEVSVGDNNSGFNDLVMPFMEYAGVRCAGIGGSGWGESIPNAAAALRGTGGFATPQVFKGVAPVGSTVELFINDQLITTDEVVSIAPDAPPGYGFWALEDIRLPPGVLNEVKIRVTDPNGVVSQIDRSVLGTTALLPEGGWAYLVGGGGRRTATQLDVEGFVGGARVLYGLTNDLTIGAVFAHQHDYHHFLSPESDLPVESTHVGVELFWKATDELLLITDASLSTGTFLDGSDYFDGAMFARAEYHPLANLSLSASGFVYGPAFFNGQNAQPSDRLGAWVAGEWKMLDRLSMRGAAGWVRDNLDGESDQTMRVPFQHLSIRGRPLGWFAAKYALDRIAPAHSTQSGPVLHSFEVDASPMPGLTISGLVREGDDVVIEDDRDGFFSGLNLPLIDLGQTQQRVLTARYSVGPAHSVGINYTQSDQHERAVLLHDLRTASPPYLIVHTEVGKELIDDELFFENRTDWLFDRRGEWRLGVRVRSDDSEWSMGVFLTITDQLINHDGGLTRTADFATDASTYRGIVSPDAGGGVRGRVFVDVDADGTLDRGEPGVAGVRVNVGTFAHAVTGPRGYFVVPRLRDEAETRVWLDIDTLPAIYSPTHGIQTARLAPRTLTGVNLGVAPSHAVTGSLVPNRPLPRGTHLGGVGVRLVRPGAGDEVVAESITAANGSYYLGDLRPGEYRLELDEPTLPPGAAVAPFDGAVSVPAQAEPIELELIPITIALPDGAQAAPESDGPTGGAPTNPTMVAPE